MPKCNHDFLGNRLEKKERGRLVRSQTIAHYCGRCLSVFYCDATAYVRKPLHLASNIVPDPIYPNMFRIRKEDGALADMINLTRARAVLGNKKA